MDDVRQSPFLTLMLVFLSPFYLLPCLNSGDQVQEHDPLWPDDHRGPEQHLPRNQIGQGQTSLLAPQAHCWTVMLILDIHPTIKTMYFKKNCWTTSLIDNHLKKCVSELFLNIGRITGTRKGSLWWCMKSPDGASVALLLLWNVERQLFTPVLTYSIGRVLINPTSGLNTVMEATPLLSDSHQLKNLRFN